MLFYVDIETEHKLAILDLNTVEPPVSDHPLNAKILWSRYPWTTPWTTNLDYPKMDSAAEVW